MTSWTEIVNTALIGSERKPLAIWLEAGEPTTDALGGLLSRLDQNDREGALLGAAAVVSSYERAGILPERDGQRLPDACAADDRPRCSDRAAFHLAAMLRGEQQELLPEWLAKAAEAGRRVPEEYLPTLLDLGRMREDLREVMRSTALPALGARGRWLAAQNPNWDFIAAGLDESLWETGGREQRLALLAGLRRLDAGRARELLAVTWEQESPKDRADFLAAFEQGLSMEDEAFLESALDDRRKEVRRAAADLLARLPESALCRRILERVRPLLTFKLNRLRRKVIDVTLPESCDKAMQRDGIEPKPNLPGIGEKAWWLAQMLGLIPPAVWARESGWTVDELIEVAKRGDWKSLLLDGWSQAARMYHDVEWAEALLDATTDQPRAVLLFQALPQARQEAFIVELLEKNRSARATDPSRSFIVSSHSRWGEALSRAVIDCLRFHATTDDFKTDWWWAGFLTAVGCRLNPALLSDAVDRLARATKNPADRPPALDRFLDFIQFRHEMLKEFH